MLHSNIEDDTIKVTGISSFGNVSRVTFGLQGPSRESKLMGSKPFWEIENYLILVSKYGFLLNFLKN